MAETVSPELDMTVSGTLKVDLVCLDVQRKAMGCLEEHLCPLQPYLLKLYQHLPAWWSVFILAGRKEGPGKLEGTPTKAGSVLPALSRLLSLASRSTLC